MENDPMSGQMPQPQMPQQTLANDDQRMKMMQAQQLQQQAQAMPNQLSQQLDLKSHVPGMPSPESQIAKILAMMARKPMQGPQQQQGQPMMMAQADAMNPQAQAAYLAATGESINGQRPMQTLAAQPPQQYGPARREGTGTAPSANIEGAVRVRAQRYAGMGMNPAAAQARARSELTGGR